MLNMAEQRIPPYIESLMSSDKYDVRFKQYLRNNFNDLFEGVPFKEIPMKIRLDGIFHGYRNKDTHDKFGNPLNKQETVQYKSNSNKIKNTDDTIGFLCEPSFDNKDVEKKKTVVAVVKNPSDLIPAIKCILWSKNNELKTIKDLLTFVIKEDENGTFMPYLEWVGKTSSSGEENGFIEINNEINKAIAECSLWLQKIKGRNGKLVYLYCNPTNKRQGYYYQGKLWKLKELSLINGVKEGTIQRRFQTLNIEQSIK